MTLSFHGKTIEQCEWVLKYFGTPETILYNMSFWDRSREEDDTASVSSNEEYIQLVLHRLNIDKSKMEDIKDECKFLSFLYDKELIEIIESE